MRRLLKCSFCVTAALGMVLICSGDATAGMVLAYQFTGHVTESDILPVGTPFAGEFNYDTATTGSLIQPGFMQYEAAPTTPISMSLNMGPISYSMLFTQPESPTLGAVMRVSDRTNLNFFTIQSIFPVGDQRYFTLLAFGDNTGQVISSTDLPTSLNLSSFSSAGLEFLIFQPNGDFVSTIGTIDTLTAVPEPASFTLLCVGSLGLLGYGWKRRKRAVA